MADDGGGESMTRGYRKGTWTMGETMILIEAKKMDDERRTKRSSTESNSNSNSNEGGGRRSKPTELRWKWVEDYCWRRGCLRSQNQCNDKWDNLMRDYKKVREHERRVAANRREETAHHHHLQVMSYWKMEKNIKKEMNLPGNLSHQIFQFLAEVVEKQGGQTVIADRNTTDGNELRHDISFSVPPLSRPAAAVLTAASGITLPTVPPLMPAPPPPLQPSQRQAQPRIDSDTSEYSDSPTKRRRRGRTRNGEGTSIAGVGTESGSSMDRMGNAISTSASIIAEALHACEEGEERRHRDLVSLHERRLKIEESKIEINRLGINSVVDAINKLASSLLALAPKKQQSPPR